jgi:large subunit ribosomal protein L25
MSDTLNVTLRKATGSRESRRLRDDGMVPAILYGHGEACVGLAAKREDVEAAIRHGSRVVNLTGAVKTSALVRDLQWDTYGIKPMHVDFLRVSASDRVRVKLPIELKGECPGVRAGGVLNLVMHEIEVDVPADHVEEHVYAPVGHLELGHAIKIKDLELPVGAKPVHSVEETVVTCLIPGKKPGADEAAGGSAAPEVIARKPGDAGAAAEA